MSLSVPDSIRASPARGPPMRPARSDARHPLTPSFPAHTSPDPDPPALQTPPRPSVRPRGGPDIILRWLRAAKGGVRMDAPAGKTSQAPRRRRTRVPHGRCYPVVRHWAALPLRSRPQPPSLTLLGLARPRSPLCVVWGGCRIERGSRALCSWNERASIRPAIPIMGAWA